LCVLCEQKHVTVVHSTACIYPVPTYIYQLEFLLFFLCICLNWSGISNNIVNLLYCLGIFVCTDRECNIILGSCQEFLHYPGRLSLLYHWSTCLFNFVIQLSQSFNECMNLCALSSRKHKLCHLCVVHLWCYTLTLYTFKQVNRFIRVCVIKFKVWGCKMCRKSTIMLLHYMFVMLYHVLKCLHCVSFYSDCLLTVMLACCLQANLYSVLHACWKFLFSWVIYLQNLRPCFGHFFNFIYFLDFSMMG